MSLNESSFNYAMNLETTKTITPQSVAYVLGNYWYLDISTSYLLLYPFLK